MSRWRAAGIHLGLSALIATVLVLAMYALWYPPPYFDLMGGAMLVLLIVGCDVVIGPLITLIIFRSGKKGLKLDLSVIALLQAIALSYGMSMMFEARPVFTVFVVDRFEVVAANEIKPADLAKGHSPEFASFALTGPRIVGAELPTDPQERNKLLFGEFGADAKSLPRFYVPYDKVAREAAQHAKPIAQLQDKNVALRDKISSDITKLAKPVDKLGYLPLAGRFIDMAVIVDKMSGQIFTIVDARPW